MKIILSRKGFDSSAGGCPNPIFPDGSMLALPIPDSDSRIKYQDILYTNQSEKHPLDKLVSDLTGERITAQEGAHLDPDMIRSALSERPKHWRPVLGQSGAAQGHLRKQGVEQGDIFLYWGLFREVEQNSSLNNKWRFVHSSPPIHAIWGWMTIGDVLAVDALDITDPDYTWLKYHPHYGLAPEKNNAMYLSADTLLLNDEEVLGTGCFKELIPDLQLSLIDAKANPTCKPSLWQLPGWMFPTEGKSPLTYHSKLHRWTKNDSSTCLLQSAARGQEFVLDTNDYPEAKDWLKNLIKNNGV